MKLNYLLFMRLVVFYICVWVVACSTSYAGSCAENEQSSGIWTCSGAASITDVGQGVTALDGSLTFTTTPGFDINVDPQMPYHYAVDLLTYVARESDKKEINVSFTDNNGSSITGAFGGIRVRNNSLGFTEVITTGSVRGVVGAGIYVDSPRASSKPIMIIVQGDVSGGSDGIVGRGSNVTIDAHGDVSGDRGSGIYISGRISSRLVTTGSVTGYYYGIVAGYAPSANITVSGPVIGRSEAAIYTWANGSNVILNNGAVVGGPSGKAIKDAGGDTTIVVNVGAKITGEVSLNGGNDHFTVNGGDVSAVTLLDGGDDTPIDQYTDVRSIYRCTHI